MLSRLASCDSTALSALLCRDSNDERDLCADRALRCTILITCIARGKKTLTFYEVLGDVRVASPRLCDLGRTISDLGRTIGRLRGFSASFPRTGHELDSHSKKIRCSRAAPTLDHTLAALLKANPTSLAASNTVPRVSRPN